MNRLTASKPHESTSFTGLSAVGLLQRKCDCGQHTMGGGECSNCQTKQRFLQRGTQNRELETRDSSVAPPIVHQVLSSPGQQLNTETRSFFEPRFGRDFSHVRVHTDDTAAESAHAVNSLAYTVGRDIVFGARQYAPGSAAGRRLLAHELTHTIQQAGTAGSLMNMLLVGAADDAHEREADAQATRVLESGTGVTPPGFGSPAAASLQRQPPKDKKDESAKAEKKSCMKLATKHVFSRGNDDPAECQYETARTTVSLLYDPCACSETGVTSIPLRLEYLALMGGKSFSDEAGTIPETQASRIAGRINLEESGGGAASGTLIHTEDTGKKSIPGDPGDTLAQTLNLNATVPCTGGTASGSVDLGLNVTGSGGTTRITAETVNWSLTTTAKGKISASSLSIDEATPTGRVATKTIDLAGGKKAYPKFPGTPRDKGCACHKVTGVQFGTACKPSGGAGVGPTGGG